MVPFTTHHQSKINCLLKCSSMVALWTDITNQTIQTHRTCSIQTQQKLESAMGRIAYLEELSNVVTESASPTRKKLTLVISRLGVDGLKTIHYVRYRSKDYEFNDSSGHNEQVEMLLKNERRTFFEFLLEICGLSFFLKHISFFWNIFLVQS